MPIDPKVSIEKSIPTSFCQSNSFHSFNSKTSQNPNLVASKSSNCLTDGLIEDEELIDKLFPKCRPKSKTSSASSSKSDRTNGYVKKTVSSDQTRFTESEMLNVPTNHSSSAITNGETNGSNTCDEPRRSKRKSNHPQNLPLQSRRLWNFMDISPSPSPPPLSPVEDMPNINSHKYISDSGSNNEKLALYTPTQERPSPVGQYESACFDYDHRESFNIKGRFDINSLEVNRIVHEQSNDSVNLKANQPDNVFSAKNGYYNLNDGSENIMRPQTNHRHAGAHFRLDSLLLSPDEQRESYKVTKLPNGIKKSNRFMLECDLNDEDDVLFSRINTIASTTGNGFQMKIPPNPAKSECINALPTVDKPRDRPFETFVTSEKREHSADSVKIKPKLHEENENEHMTKVNNRNNINIKGDSLSDNEEDEVERNSGTLNRNRIEIAGGKELFSSSRSTRAKRRSTNQMKFGPSEQRRDSVLSRHTQLYSVSMAADSEQVWDSATSSAATNKLVDEESSQTVAREADKPQQTQTQPIVTLASDSQAATGNDCNLVRAQITSSLSTDSNQHPAQNLNDTKLISSKDSTLTDLCSRHQTFFDVNETKESEPRQCVSVVHENLAHSLDKYTLHKTQVNQASGLDTLSSRRKSTMTMTFEDENNSPKMSFRDNVANKNELMSCNFFDDSLQGTKCAELKLEESFHNATQAKDIRPLNKQDQESDLCNQMQQSVNLSCDQFAQDLKMKLDIVSNCGGSNYADTQCDNENKVSELDSDSVKSASLSQKSFEGNDRIARVIGSVPIAQYEGSPKRYGPKPGYPKRVLSTSSNNSNDYETIPPKKIETATDDIGHKSTVLSSENGSPHSSTSSTSSATFSSTDIHSSSSFSCPSNQKSNGFSNWNIQSRVKDNFDTPLNGFSEHRKSSYEENTLNAKTESNSMHQVTCDEIVKTILSLPSGPIDTEDDIDEVTSSSDKPIDSFSNDNLPGCEPNRLPNEPIYSSITGSGYSADANKSSGYSSKRSLHSDDSESVTKSKTSISSNGCDRNITRSTTSIKTQQSDIPVRGQKELNKMSSSQFANEQRNIPKSFRTDHYSRHLEESQSFESTDSSYRSDKYPSKDYYDQSDEDGYMFGQNYPIKQVSLNGSRLNGNSNDGRNLLEPMPSSQITQLNYTCLSPELSSQDLKSQAKLYTESAYESAGYPSDQCDAYSDNMTNDKTASGCVPGVRISTMPVLEDGLSSGMPSSDEMEYDEDEDGEDDLMTHEHDDLDDYVDEYNRRTGPCDSILPSQFPVNGPNTNSTNYGFHYKQQTQNDYNRTNKIGGQSQPLYRCATKTGTSFGLELSEDLSDQTSIDKKDSLDYFNGHHHHLNHHVHNHPVLDDNSRANLSSYENGKHSTNTPGQDVSYNHDKFCISSQLRSVSNSSSNNSSMSTVRNATCQLGPSGPKQQSTSPPPPNPSHHHYHHYYHSHHPGSSLQQPITNRQNYPNLSSSPTSLSPNSPGGMHHQSSASSSSSSSHPASSAPHHYHQQQAHPSQTSSQPQEMVATNSPSSSLGGVTAPNVRHHHDEDCDTDQETDRLLGSQRNDDRGFYDDKVRVHAFESAQLKRSSTSREAFPPKVLIEGVLFRARYLGSTQLVCDGQPTKATRMMQAEEAVSRIKAPEGETQPSTEVDLFISTEKIMVLNTDLKEIMMDHALRTISYIADIGDLLVLMARRRTPIDDPNDSGIKRIPKMICHVFESEEAQYIAQSIGQAFQVAYMEFLKANGIEDSSFLKEMDYQEVLNSQEIFGNELEMFAKREKQKEVIVPKQKGEILGIVIVESGWGSMLPTVVIANMAQSSPSARCGQLNIGDQIIAINGISLVGLPLSTCQAYVKNTKNQTAVKFTIVPCAPVVEVKIKRPDTKYQLGFSVQNGVICSLLRGGIAERGGVRVGHRIIEINGQSVVAVPHDRIVNLLATSVGEIHMKTMPTSMFRLLTGQDSPSYM